MSYSTDGSITLTATGSPQVAGSVRARRQGVRIISRPGTHRFGRITAGSKQLIVGGQSPSFTEKTGSTVLIVSGASSPSGQYNVRAIQPGSTILVTANTSQFFRPSLFVYATLSKIPETITVVLSQ